MAMLRGPYGMRIAAALLLLAPAVGAAWPFAVEQTTMAGRLAAARKSYFAGDYRAARAELQAVIPGLEETAAADAVKGEAYLFLGAALEKLRKRDLAVVNYCRARALLGEGTGSGGLDPARLKYYARPCPPPLTPAQD